MKVHADPRHAIREFWDSNPCDSNLSTETDRRQYFDEIRRKRYESSPHIPRVAAFAEHHDQDVLEIGCGIGTDGLEFARNGARYTGVDMSPAAIEMARERFGLYGATGRLQVADAAQLPFPDESFDYVYSFGVIHHSPDTAAIVAEMRRVLKPGGTVCVMVYNRSSINYHVEIMGLRRLLRLLLYPRFMPALMSRLTGVDEWKLQGHRKHLLSKPRMSRQEWLSINTDGPHNPLSKVYNRREAMELFKDFDDVRTEVFHFDRSHWAGLGRLLPQSLTRQLGRNWGWHRMVYARKAMSSSGRGPSPAPSIP